MQYLVKRLGTRLALERRPPRQHLVKDGAQRVDVGEGPDLPGAAAGLLRCHVAGRADQVARLRPAGRVVQVLGQAEVGDLGRAVGGEQDVGRLQIPVDDTALVGAMDRAGQKGRSPGGVPGRLRTAVETLGQAVAGHELHREEGSALPGADLVDLDNVGVLEPGDQAGFGFEAGQRPGRRVRPVAQHLQGHDALEGEVAGLVDDAHASAAQLTQHFVARHGRRRGGGGKFRTQVVRGVVVLVGRRRL